MTTIQLLIFFYVAMGFAKATLMLVSIPVACAAMDRHLRKSGDASRSSFWGALAIIVLTVAYYSFVEWPRLLKEEKGRFFLTYKKFHVMREVLAGAREQDF